MTTVRGPAKKVGRCKPLNGFLVSIGGPSGLLLSIKLEDGRVIRIDIDDKAAIENVAFAARKAGWK